MKESKTLMLSVLNSSTVRLVLIADGWMVKSSGKNAAMLALALSKQKKEEFHQLDVMECKIHTLNVQHTSAKSHAMDENGLMVRFSGKNAVKLASKKKLKIGPKEMPLTRHLKDGALEIVIGTQNALNSFLETPAMVNLGQMVLSTGTSVAILVMLCKVVQAPQWQPTSVRTILTITPTVVKWLMEDLVMAANGEMEHSSGKSAVSLVKNKHLVTVTGTLLIQTQTQAQMVDHQSG